jgi:hypothetical protein
MTLWRRFQEWRSDRLITRCVYAGAEAMLDLAARQFSEQLTDAEKDALVASYGQWLTSGGDDRLNAFIDEPVRTIHLFLSEVIR